MAKRKTKGQTGDEGGSTAAADGAETPGRDTQPVLTRLVVMSRPDPSELDDGDDPPANVHLDLKLINRPAPDRGEKTTPKANTRFEIKPFYGRRKARKAPSIGSMQVPGKS